jgi:hypothetical protein
MNLLASARTTLAVILVAASGCLPQTTPPPVQPIYRLDLTGLNALDLKDPAAARLAWDTLQAATSIQGIVNRDGANLFIRHMPETDDFWWNYLRDENGWLKGRPVVEVSDVADLLRRLAPQLKGAVLYKEEVHATANLASTIAGVEDRLSLRYDPSPNSVYSRLSQLPEFPKDVLKLFREDGSPMFTGKGKIPDTDRDSTGSAKNDAYLWAKARYLDAGKCSSEYLSYFIDSYWLTAPFECDLFNSTMANHDFFIAQRAFFFDLGMWPDEPQVDDPGQKPGTDLLTLQAILKSMHQSAGDRIFIVGGFVPWVWKYCGPGEGWKGSGGKHGPVASEWQYAKTISAYNGIMDADAIGFSGLANASFYQHFPLKKHYPQNPKPTVADLKARGLILPDGSVKPAAYVTFYMGDYDAASWLCQFVPKWWADPQHGKVICNWGFNPNLDRRVPHVMDYVRTHQAATDWFISGDGYLNPGMLAAPRLDPEVKDGWDAWVRFNREYYDRYDLTVSGFVIEGAAPQMGERGLDEYAKFSPDGMLLLTDNTTFGHIALHRGTMPYIRHRKDLTPEDPAKAGPELAATVAAEQKDFPGGTQFLMVRTILKSPTWHAETMAAAQAAPGGGRIDFVDAYTFFLLMKTHLEQQAAKP